MASRKTEAVESVESVEEVASKVIPNLRQRYLFFKSLDERMNKDKRGRVSLCQHIIMTRRRLVKELFNGENQAQIANSLGCSTDTVNNDIRYNYAETKKRCILKVYKG